MSKLPELIEYASQTAAFPVKIESVKNWFINNGYQEKINILEVDMPSDVCAAIFERRNDVAMPYSEVPRVTNILLSNELNECWRRLIACKELIHLMDANGNRANSREQIKTLINEIITFANNNFRPIGSMSPACTADLMAMERALYLLAPASAIDQIKPHYESGTIDNMDIALFFKIPVVTVDHIMSDQYADAYTRAKFEIVGQKNEIAG